MVEDMAQKHIVQLIDDLDQGVAEETVSFSLDGSSYEIDLSAKNAARIEIIIYRGIFRPGSSTSSPKKQML